MAIFSCYFDNSDTFPQVSPMISDRARPEYLYHIDILSCFSFFGYAPDGGIPEGGVLFTIPPGGNP